MKISDLSEATLAQRLRKGDVLLDIHPFVARIKSDVSHLVPDFALVYGDFHLCAADSFADFHIEVKRQFGLKDGFGPRAVFKSDGRPYFVPLSPGQALAGLEWGLNWCVTSTCHQYLIIHAAVVEKNGQTAVLPAPPGSGKSTLCAALVLQGWRLLSDELALYDMDTGLVYGMSRPINLKNKSIDVIRQFAPHARLTPPVPNTSKGTVALVRPPVESVQRAREPARPSWIILPKYEAAAPPALVRHSRAKTFMLLAEQSFNYHIHGRRGFDALGQLVDRCGCYRFTYSQLDDAMQVFDGLLEGTAA